MSTAAARFPSPPFSLAKFGYGGLPASLLLAPLGLNAQRQGMLRMAAVNGYASSIVSLFGAVDRGLAMDLRDLGTRLGCALNIWSVIPNVVTRPEQSTFLAWRRFGDHR
mgnify:FL=1